MTDNTETTAVSSLLLITTMFAASWSRWVVPDLSTWGNLSVETSIIPMNTYDTKADKREPKKTNSQQNTPIEDPKGDRRELLHLVTQSTRYEILQNIIAHPKQLPSLKELNYFIPGTSKSTIRNHLDRLIENELVTKVEISEEEKSRDNPRVFYGLTSGCYDLFEEAGLLRAEKELQEATLDTQLTPDIEQYLNAPRPEWPPANPLEN